jgi:hypothetical protein
MMKRARSKFDTENRYVLGRSNLCYSILETSDHKAHSVDGHGSRHELSLGLLSMMRFQDKLEEGESHECNSFVKSRIIGGRRPSRIVVPTNSKPHVQTASIQ